MEYETMNHLIDNIPDFETFNKIRFDDEETVIWQQKGLELIGSFYLLLGTITKTAQIAEYPAIQRK